MHLETERLAMPPLTGQHTEALTEVYADPHVARYIGGATLDADGTAAQVELGFVLAGHAQGRGLATEAARAWLDVASGELGLHRITTVIHPDNAASRALVTRLSFRVHREDVTPSGVRVLVHELVPAG